MSGRLDGPDGIADLAIAFDYENDFVVEVNTRFCCNGCHIHDDFVFGLVVSPRFMRVSEYRHSMTFLEHLMQGAPPEHPTFAAAQQSQAPKHFDLALSMSFPWIVSCFRMISGRWKPLSHQKHLNGL